MFERKGQIFIPAQGVDEEAALEAALEAGAEDLVREDDRYVISTDPASLHAVKAALDAKNVATDGAEIAMIPKTTVHVEGKTAETLLKLMEELDDLDDVQKVEANFDIDLAEMAKA